MWLIADAPVTVRTAYGDVKLTPGIPHELSDAVGERVLQCAGERVRVHAQEPAQTTLSELAAPNARPVYWERADTSIVGPATVEFVTQTGEGLTRQYWVAVVYEGMPVLVDSTWLRSKRQFEQRVQPKAVELVREPRP